MFAHDLCHSPIEYFRNSTRREPLGRTIDLNRKDRAQRYHKSSIFNRQYSIPACPGWVYVNSEATRLMFRATSVQASSRSVQRVVGLPSRGRAVSLASGDSSHMAERTMIGSTCTSPALLYELLLSPLIF